MRALVTRADDKTVRALVAGRVLVVVVRRISVVVRVLVAWADDRIDRALVVVVRVLVAWADDRIDRALVVGLWEDEDDRADDKILRALVPVLGIDGEALGHSPPLLHSEIVVVTVTTPEVNIGSTTEFDKVVYATISGAPLAKCSVAIEWNVEQWFDRFCKKCFMTYHQSYQPKRGRTAR